MVAEARPRIVIMGNQGLDVAQGADGSLKVSTGTGAPPATYVTVKPTTSGNTEIIIPSTGKRILVHYFGYSNAHTTSVSIGMRFGSTGDIKHRAVLAAEGGNMNANLTGAPWGGDIDETLYAYLDANYSGGVYFTVGFTEEE